MYERSCWSATSCLLPVCVVIAFVAGCDDKFDEFGEPDEEMRRDLAKCGKPTDPQIAPPGTYVDHGIAIDYARVAPPGDPNNGDGGYMRRIMRDPRMLEQVYADATGGNATARWAICAFEAGSRGAAREGARQLFRLHCQTIANCEFHPEQLPYSDTTASGIRVLTLIADDFEAEARRRQVAQEIFTHMLTLFVATRALSARAAAQELPAMSRPAPYRPASVAGVTGEAAAEQSAVRELSATELAGVRGAGPVRRFNSFRAFKRAMGPAGKGKQWHHIVEQHEGNVARFGAEEIHNTSNVIAIDAEIHRKLSGHYSSITDASKPLTVRKWLSGKSFEEQRAYGIDMLRKYGAIP